MSDSKSTPSPADVAAKVEPAQAQPESDTKPEPKVDELDWKAEARKWEQRAKENKTAADRLAELEQAQLSETEKAQKRLADAEAEVANVPSKVTDALRGHLVSLHEISEEDAELFLTATSPELLLKQVGRLVDKGNGRKSNTVPREGTNNTPADDKDAQARAFFGLNQ